MSLSLSGETLAATSRSTLFGGVSASAATVAASTTSNSLNANPNQRTKRPITTGTSVIGITYKNGVMLAADTLCSYGTMAKFKDARRLKVVNSRTILGGGGEISDFTAICELLERNALENQCTSDSLYDDEDMESEENSPEVWSYLRAVMYNRRNKMDPLWNDLIVGGYDYVKKEPFLGLVDKIGTAYTDNILATGFGSYLATPILREKWRPDLEEGEARAMLEDCMRVLFYRDCRALNRIQIAKVEMVGNGKALVSEPYDIETNWDSANFVNNEDDGGW